MLIEPNRTLVRRAVDEFYNPGNLAAADNLFAPNYVNHDPNAPEARTLEGLKALHAARIAAFPDQKVTIEAMFAEGDMVAKRWSWHGTHLGEFFGVRVAVGVEHVDHQQRGFSQYESIHCSPSF